MKKIFYILVSVLMLSACGLPETNVNTISIQQETPEKSVLIDYLSALKLKNFEQAAFDYGGDYSQLMALIPEVKADFKSKFFEIYCLKKNAACLNYEIKGIERISDDAYRFQVQFLYNDGTVFPASNCPCQGGSKQSIFNFRVNKIGNEFKVLDIPPREL